MKAYTDSDAPGMAPAAALEALGVPRHVRQVSLLIAAPTKAAAATLSEQRGIRRDIRSLRLASGNVLDALTTAGLMNEPAVYVTSLDGVDSAVVKLTDDRAVVEIVGRLVRGENFTRRFEPVAVDPQDIPSADLPRGSIVADDERVWIKDVQEGDTLSSPWNGKGGRHTDRSLDIQRKDFGARVIRVGTTPVNS